MRARMFLLLAVLLPVGCIQDLLDAGAALSPDTDAASSSGTSTGEQATPTTSAGSGVQTVTGPPGEPDETTGTTTPEPETTGAPEENIPPTVDLALADADAYLSEAGSTQLLLTASMDVVTVRLSMDGALLAELTPADFPYTYEALSAKDNGNPHVFVAEVEDAEGLTASDDADLTVQLPASGAERCLFEDKSAVQSVISALVYTDEAIVAAGWRDVGLGPRATIWKLPPDHCEQPLPGWPKTITNWTDDPLAVLESRASAVAVDDLGNLAVGITLTNGGKPQRYVAFLTPGGSLLWHRPGKVGEEVAGIAVVPGGVVAVGWARTSENPVRTDAMLWRHLEGGGNVWPQTLKAPFTPDELDPDAFNVFSERARAAYYDPETDLLVIGGDRELKDSDLKVYRRSFIARFVPLGLQFGEPWTSPGDPLKNDGVASIARCGAEILLGGWTQDWPPGSLPQPLTRWLAADGTADTRVPEQLSDAQTLGIACDREGKVIHAATRSPGTDAQVFAFEDPKKPRVWYDKGSAGSDAAHTIDCDARGFCAWGGFRTVNGKMVAIVRGHHP